MKKILVLLVACAILFFVFKFLFNTQPTVLISDNGFYPKNITVSKGEKIIFKNIGKETHWPASNNHPTHLLYPNLDTERPLKNGETWEFSASKIGEWKIHDHLYPQNTGEVIIDGSHKNYQNPVEKLSVISRDLLARFTFSSNKNTNKSIEDVKTIVKPEDIYKKQKMNCKPIDNNCIGSYLASITTNYGPQNSLSLLEMLVEKGDISKTLDIHQFSHVIGRRTAQVFGINPKSFFQCPMTVAGEGCLHGFFEYSLSTTGSIEETVSKLCKDLQNNTPGKILFSCYHGLGHGIMMARKYDVNVSLKECDKLQPHQAQEGCWQGVFMENLQAYFAGFARTEYFTKDPLGLCISLDKKYSDQCYLNQSVYLLDKSTSFREAGQSCLNVPSLHKCARGLGTYTIELSWLGKKGINSNLDQSVEKSAQICESFPDLVRTDCFQGAMSNLFNRDYPNLYSRILKYCELTDSWSKTDCYQEIGVNIGASNLELNAKKEECALVPSQFLANCYQGAEVN